MLHMIPSNSLKPTSQLERIQILDILRGFAIFGIFVVNVEIMNCLFINGDSFGAQWTSTIAIYATKIKLLFFYSKFFPIFSLLFGVGISIQLMSMHRKGTSAIFFYRRMFALFIFGVCHSVFLWSGDVIHLYALLGLLTLTIVKWQPKYLLLTAIILLVFPFYNQLSEVILSSTGYDAHRFLATYTPEDIRTTIRSASYFDGMILRIREYGSNIPLLYVFLRPIALAMFLLGLYIGKRGYLKDIPTHIKRLKKPVLVIALVSNTYRVIFIFFTWETEVWKDPFWREVLIYVMQLCDTLMGLFYVWLVAYLFQFKWWQRVLKPLRYAGRMALTNYLLQSLIGLFLFSSIGLGWYESLSPFQTLVLAISVFIFQVLLSTLWLSYFLFGPMEWVWRCISYWKWLPLRIRE